MTTPTQEIDPLAAEASGSMLEAVHEAQHAFERVADRLSDYFNDLAQLSKDAANDTQHSLAHSAYKASSSAEHYIHCAPFKSVIIAAGVGAATATMVHWLTRPRQN